MVSSRSTRCPVHVLALTSVLLVVALSFGTLTAASGQTTEELPHRPTERSAQAAKRALVKLGGRPVHNRREASRRLRATPPSFRRFVVVQLRRTQQRSCAPGETRRGSITATWYHRRGFAVGYVEACTIGYSVVWRRAARRWREAVVFQAAPECRQLRRQRVPRNLWRKGFGPMCATDAGYVTYTGPR